MRGLSRVPPKWYGLLLEKHRLRSLASKESVDDKWVALHRFVLPITQNGSAEKEPCITGWIYGGLVSDPLLRSLEEKRLDCEFVDYGRRAVVYRHFEDHPRRLLLFDIMTKWWWDPESAIPGDAGSWAVRMHRHAGWCFRRFTARLRRMSHQHPDFLSFYHSLGSADLEHLDDMLNHPDTESRYRPIPPEASSEALEQEYRGWEWFEDVRNDARSGQLWEFVITNREDPSDPQFAKTLLDLLSRGIIVDEEEKEKLEK